MMLSACLALPLLGLSSLVRSFPTSSSSAAAAVNAHVEVSTEELSKIIDDVQKAKRFVVADGKPVDVSGKHAFQPPKVDDQRGPCPGLNALANHGYIPRDGIASTVEVMAATNEVFGMSIEVGLLLGVMGTVWGGNPLSPDPGFSIGGEADSQSNLLSDLRGLLGKPRGLAGTHNFIESDASNTRDDLYMTGDATTMNMTRFLDLYNSMQNGVLTFDDFGAQIEKRFKESKATNPYFYSGPYTGMIARNAGYALGARLLSNHTAEHPEGQMTPEVLKSFWAVTDNPNTPSGLAYHKGHERIPANFYKSPVDYTLAALNLDLITWWQKYPATLSIGGNMGTPNSFVGLDLDNISGGVLNAQTLLETNGLVCFVLEVVKTFAPNLLGGLFGAVDEVVGVVQGKLTAEALNVTGCPVWGDLGVEGEGLLRRLMEFPGAERAKSAL